jgi:hypothetical protein
MIEFMKSDNDGEGKGRAFGPISTIQIGLAITIFGSAAWLIWGAAEFRSQMLADMGWMKTSLVSLTTRFSEMDVLKNRIDTMNKIGTDSLKDTEQLVLSLKQKVEAYQSYGSPVDVKYFQDINARIDKVEKDFEVHKATTK